jgi:hypothetical protein
MFAASALLVALLWTQDVHAKTTSEQLSLRANRVLQHTLIMPATGIAVTLENEEPVEVQVQENGVWSAWMPLRKDNDAYVWEKDSELIITDDATAVRLRSPSNTKLTLHIIAVDTAATEWEEVSARRLIAPVIIPRWQWGADEELRRSKRGAKEMRRIFDEHDPMLADRIRNCDRRAYLYPEEFTEFNRRYTDDEGYTLAWPQGYSPKINLFVLHHTAESSPAGNRRNDIERIRAVYEYHTVTRGWGDIGYNFVIGPTGSIFEGRAGGDYVVGAHAYCNNVGTIGISLMGNFQNGRPTDEQSAALRWLLIHLSDKYDVDPDSKTIHHGRSMPTIVGHRDVGKTACPGNYSYELLPQIRIAAKERDVGSTLFSSVASASSQNEAALMASLLPLTVSMGKRDTVKVEFMNVGLDVWNKDTWLLAEENADVYFTEFSPFSYVAGFLEEQHVPSGEIGTFNIKLQGGLSAGEGSVRLTPVINNDRRLVNNAAILPYRVLAAAPRYTPVTLSFPGLHKNGEDLTGTVKLINSGNVPWERNTITEIHFDVGDGDGDVTIVEYPPSVLPGEQRLFRVRIQNIDELGSYTRTLIPRFLEGSPLQGSTLRITSKAEPIPDIALIASSAGPPIRTAESQLSASAGHGVASAFGPSHRRPVTESDDVLIEALAGTQITLAPREQAEIPLRIRAGKNGVGKFQAIASVVRSNPTIILRDEKGFRLRNEFRSPVSLRRFQTYDEKLTIIAPRQEGEHTFSIGDITFTLIVNPSGRYTIRKSVPRKLLRHTSIEEMRNRRSERRQRILRTAPPPVIQNKEDVNIRIRLTYQKDNAILTSPQTVRIEGAGNIIFANGPLHLSMEQGQCKIITSNGQFIAPAIRMTPGGSSNASMTIMTLAKHTNRFRGTLECRIVDGVFTIINELPMEKYLAGLAEEPDSEPYEKQRAFAIAARSYATHYVISGQRKFPGKPFDGSDSPAEFQVYGGMYFEEKNPRWVDAVQSTSEKVLTWERKVVKAPYFSSDSGSTNSALDVWGWTNTPYLDAKDDPWCAGMQSRGHGVGMSGCGAKGQANEGKTAEDILLYYYPGTRILPTSTLMD